MHLRINSEIEQAEIVKGGEEIINKNISNISETSVVGCHLTQIFGLIQ
jgi:hypothetical protein